MPFIAFSIKAPLATLLPLTLINTSVESATKISVSQRYLEELSAVELGNYIDKAVSADISGDSTEALSGDGPVIIFSPHFGSFAQGAIWIARNLRRHAEIGFFYNPPETNPYSPTMTRLLERAEPRAVPIFNDRRGLLRAVRLLREGRTIVIMPDLFQRSDSTILVPFYGHLVRAMPGIAYLARKVGATLIPAYCEWTGLHRFSGIIDGPISFDESEDFERDLIRLTSAAYASMERRFDVNLEQWLLLREVQGWWTGIPEKPNRATLSGIISDCAAIRDKPEKLVADIQQLVTIMNFLPES